MRSIKQTQLFKVLILSGIVFLMVIVAIMIVMKYQHCSSGIKNHESRDFAYEKYCDSIFVVNPNYYYDELVETDEYEQYIKEHGIWWKE